jgi:predicted nuclease with TOPRIM domain
MSKEYEKIRLKIKKEYEEQLKELNRLKKMEIEYLELKHEVDKIKDENARLKDWNERLLEYCNLSETDMELLHTDLKVKKNFNAFSKMLSDMDMDGYPTVPYFKNFIGE